MAQHRVRFREFGSTPLHLCHVLAQCGGQLGDLVVAMRQELVQRRVEQPYRHRQAGHDAEQFDEILALERQQLFQRHAAAGLVAGHDHLPHRADALGCEKHVFGAAQTDALCTEFARGFRVQRGFGICAYLQPARLVRPLHQRREIAGQCGFDGRHLAHEDLAGGTIDGDRLARRG